MKKLLLCMLLLPVLVGASDQTVLYIDTINAADTADVRADTVYTPAEYIGEFDYLSFYSEVQPWQTGDTNFADDTFFVLFQHSPDGKRWYTSLEIDTFLTTGYSYSKDVLSRADSAFGNWGRGMFIHWDSIGVGDGGIEGNVYYKQFKFWIFGH